MSAMFAFEIGDISMRSATFENVMTELLARSTDSVDRQVWQDALDLNCLWVDQIPENLRCPLLVSLYDVLLRMLRGEAYRRNDTALFEIGEVMKELVVRYPGCLETESST